MPLISYGSKAVSHDKRKAIGFWMSVEGKDPVEFVRVFVTFRTLEQLDPSQIPDLHSAFQIFEAHRGKIEQVASQHFDTIGVDADDHYQNQPVVTLASRELLSRQHRAAEGS